MAKKTFLPASLLKDYITDKQRLDFLQELNNKAEYTGKCELRISLRGRGWRLHETTGAYAWEDVREAIDFFMTYEYKQGKDVKGSKGKN